MKPLRKNQALIAAKREDFHRALLDGPLVLTNGIPSIADGPNKRSVRLARAMMERMGAARSTASKQAGQTSGGEFETLVADFVRGTFPVLGHLRPGKWSIVTNPGHIGQFEQYHPLETLLRVIQANPETRTSLGGDYLIKPDIIVAREPEDDATINPPGKTLVADDVPPHAPLRKVNNALPILHASVSCKWTIRSDRSQNTRTEALNLMRNRKGTVPHVVAVTAEPLPSRIGSIAYGTGDLDCVYHVALPELIEACRAEDDEEEIIVLVEGRRLRDISDLPLDLAI